MSTKSTDSLQDNNRTTDSSEDEENCPNSAWTPYSEREDWKDVTPIPQDEGEHPVVAIAYTKQFIDAYDYLRAIIKSEEKSERALELISNCLDLNPANYTAWEYRRQILKELNKDLMEELQYVNHMIEENPKNYQTWHHRKLIVTSLGNVSEELSFTNSIFNDDPKNYHCWQYRQWYIKTFNMFDKELEYSNSLIEKDIRNNSAWNQRYFVIEHTTTFKPDIIDREVDYALEKIMEVKKNESAWCYLKGVLAKCKNGGLGCNKKVASQCRALYESGNKTNHLLVCIIDIIVDRFENCEPMDEFYNPQTAFELCEMLENKYDKIRRNYWKYVNNNLKEMFRIESE